MSDRPHSFLSPKCEVHQTPDRGGHTVVAREAIAKGELIVVWSGTLVSGEELNEMPQTVRRYSLQVEENQYLVSLSDCEPPDYVNHCCDPNSGLSGQITLVAMRDIKPGEEITYDYAMSDGSPYDEFSCSCGSPHCRGHVSGEDWMRLRSLATVRWIFLALSAAAHHGSRGVARSRSQAPPRFKEVGRRAGRRPGGVTASTRYCPPPSFRSTCASNVR